MYLIMVFTYKENHILLLLYILVVKATYVRDELCCRHFLRLLRPYIIWFQYTSPGTTCIPSSHRSAFVYVYY